MGDERVDKSTRQYGLQKGQFRDISGGRIAVRIEPGREEWEIEFGSPEEGKQAASIVAALKKEPEDQKDREGKKGKLAQKLKETLAIEPIKGVFAMIVAFLLRRLGLSP